METRSAVGRLPLPRRVPAALPVAAFAAAAAVCALVPRPASAAREWRASPWLSLEFASMKAVETELDTIAHMAEDEFRGGLAAWGETAEGEVTGSPLGSGMGFGIDIGRMVGPRMGAGLRAGTVQFHGQFAKYEGRGSMGETYTDRWSIDHSFTMVAGGLWLDGGNPRGLSWRGSVFVGPAWADASFEQTGFFRDPVALVDMSWDGKGRLTGSTLAFELGLRGSWRIAEAVRVFAEAGYLMAAVREMRWRSDVDMDGDGKDEYRQGTILLSHPDRQPLVFDYGGARLRAGVTVSFGGAAGPDYGEEPGY